jgi:hypothetical protein
MTRRGPAPMLDIATVHHPFCGYVRGRSLRPLGAVAHVSIMRR